MKSSKISTLSSLINCTNFSPRQPKNKKGTGWQCLWRIQSRWDPDNFTSFSKHFNLFHQQQRIILAFPYHVFFGRLLFLIIRKINVTHGSAKTPEGDSFIKMYCWDLEFKNIYCKCYFNKIHFNILFTGKGKKMKICGRKWYRIQVLVQCSFRIRLKLNGPQHWQESCNTLTRIMQFFLILKCFPVLG